MLNKLVLLFFPPDIFVGPFCLSLAPFLAWAEPTSEVNGDPSFLLRLPLGTSLALSL